MYTVKNFKTKKELKEAVAKWIAYETMKVEIKPMTVGAVLIQRDNIVPPQAVRIFQPGGIFNPPQAHPTHTGVVCVEGPHFPKPHTWYASVTLKDGIVVKVK